MTQPGQSIAVGDRVEVHPQSARLMHLQGQAGTVVFIHPEDGEPLGGSLHVLLDGDEETLGLGADFVTRLSQ
jgi:hypothetical protein